MAAGGIVKGVINDGAVVVDVCINGAGMEVTGLVVGIIVSDCVIVLDAFGFSKGDGVSCDRCDDGGSVEMLVLLVVLLLLVLVLVLVLMVLPTWARDDEFVEVLPNDDDDVDDVNDEDDMDVIIAGFEPVGPVSKRTGTARVHPAGTTSSTEIGCESSSSTK